MDLAHVRFYVWPTMTDEQKAPAGKRQVMKMFRVNADTSVDWLLVIVIAIILLIAFIRAVSYFYEFSQELKYLNIEINRTHGDEHKYWLHRRRRLWLSLIPFVKYR